MPHAAQHNVLGSDDVLARHAHAFQIISHPLFVNIKAGEILQSRPVDREGQRRPVDHRPNTVLVEAPCRKSRQIFEDLVAVGVKNVGAIVVNTNAMGIVTIKGVAAYVRPAVNDQNFVAGARQPFGACRAGETGAYYQEIIFHNHSLAVAPAHHMTGTARVT